MKQSEIAVLGTPVSSGNRGVLALGASLINLCSMEGGSVTLLIGQSHHRPASFRVNSAPRDIRVVNCRLSPVSRPNEHLAWIVLASLIYRFVPLQSVRRVLNRISWIKAVSDADFVGDVRGGDSFSDIYGMRRFLLGFLMAWTVVLIKGSIVQFPQTFGPYRSRLARSLARYLLRRSSVIIARDSESQCIARSLVGVDKPVLLSPDVAFSLEVVVPAQIQLEPPGLSITEPTPPIGLNVNGLLFNAGYSGKDHFGLKLEYRTFLPDLIKALLSLHPGDLWLVPHTYGPSQSAESDPEACRLVRASIPGVLQSRVRIVTAEYDCHEIKGVIGKCDFFIGSRMHSCIAALSQGIPCVGVAYSMKFEGVFESVGMREWVIDGRCVRNDSAVSRTVELYRQRDRVRKELASEAQKARERLTDVFKSILAR